MNTSKTIIFVILILSLLSQSCSKSSNDDVQTVDDSPKIEEPNLPDTPDEEDSILPPVSGVTAVLESTNIKISWQSINDEDLTGYSVYRTQIGLGEAIEIASETSDLFYIDNNIENGNAYQYEVIAIDEDGNKGAKGAIASLFFAYNNTIITDLRVSREGVNAKLVWADIAEVGYRIYRAEESKELQAVIDLDNNNFLDKNSLWDKKYEYKVASIATFFNRLTEKNQQILGPLSSSVRLTSLPPLKMSINDAVMGLNNISTLFVDNLSGMTISGTYSEALGSVKITAKNGSDTVSTTSDTGNYQLFLPLSDKLNWVISLSEQNNANRTTSQNLTLLKDQTPPIISIDGSTARTVNTDAIILEGSVTDDYTNRITTVVISDRYADQSFGAIQSSNSRFYAEVPIKLGGNNLTVVSTDVSGNRSRVKIAVTRSISSSPSISISNPVNGSVVTTDKISLQGTVYSSQSPDKLRITLGDQQQFPEKTSMAGIYSYEFSGVLLEEGFNALSVVVESPLGSARTSVTVTYKLKNDKTDKSSALVINITNPTLKTSVNELSIIVAGSVTSDVGIKKLTINDNRISIDQINIQSFRFQERIELINDENNEQTITLSATDTRGKESKKIISIHYDGTKPIMALTTKNILPSPAINTVVESPFLIEGVITEKNLAGLNINNKFVGVLPGTNDQYSFSVELSLTQGIDTPVLIEAWDFSGNRSKLAFNLNSTSIVAIEVVSPVNNSDLFVSGNQTTINIVARINGDTNNLVVSAFTDQNATQALIADNNIYRGNINLNTTDGKHKVVIEVRDINNDLVAATSTSINLSNSDNIPLKARETNPKNNANGVEPNTFISFYFNKTIDPSLLQISIKETAHGQAYDLDKLSDIDPIKIGNQFELISVSHDLVPIAGSIASFPSDSMIAFYPANDFVYGAKIFVEATYNNKSISRFSFSIRDLPTFLRGFVVDQLLQPVTGLEAYLPDLERTAITDSEGVFSFGFGDNAKNTLPAGRQRLVINPSNISSAYSTIEIWGNIEQGRLTNIGQVIVPVLNKAVPYRRIVSGEPQTLLSGKELVLDLSNATLVFPSGQDQGDIHVQFLVAHNIMPTAPSFAIPRWLYAIQPKGIEVTGLSKIEFTMPTLFGSYKYIPRDGALTLLVGYDADKIRLKPIGVGRIQQRKVISEGKLHLTHLDYLGYVIKGAAAQNLMQRYLNSDITFNAMLAEMSKLSN